MAREWIIQAERHQIGDSNNYEIIQIANGEYVGKDKIKVIEHSAYLELKEQLARAEELLRLYADCPESSGMYEPSINGGEYMPLGKRAREYFKAKDGANT